MKRYVVTYKKELKDTKAYVRDNNGKGYIYDDADDIAAHLLVMGFTEVKVVEIKNGN